MQKALSKVHKFIHVDIRGMVIFISVLAELISFVHKIKLNVNVVRQ